MMKKKIKIFLLGKISSHKDWESEKNHENNYFRSAPSTISFRNTNFFDDSIRNFTRITIVLKMHNLKILQKDFTKNFRNFEYERRNFLSNGFNWKKTYVNYLTSDSITTETSAMKYSMISKIATLLS